MIRDLVDQWTERFGEPPPIRTDPDLMRSVLEDCEPRARRREAECSAPPA